MLLRNLPPKMSERIRKSVTWTEVATAPHRRLRLRNALARITHRGWVGWHAALRKSLKIRAP
jgi:hypothetical protein